MGLRPLALAARTIATTDIRDRVAVAAGAGYTAIGLTFELYCAARDSGLADRDLRALLAEHEVAVVEVQSVHGWAGSAAQRAEALRMTRDCLTVCAAVGASYVSINLTDLDGGIAGAAEGFAAVAALVEGAGVLAALEYLAWGPIPDAATAWAVIERSAAPNGRVLVDSWQHFMGPGRSAGLEALPPERIGGVQVADGTGAVVRSLAEDSKDERCYPGDGSFDLVAFLAAVERMGVNAPLSVEVLSSRCRELPDDLVATQAAVSTLRVLEAARGSRR